MQCRRQARLRHGGRGVALFGDGERHVGSYLNCGCAKTRVATPVSGQELQEVAASERFDPIGLIQADFSTADVERSPILISRWLS
jgi:hypothetical protein